MRLGGPGLLAACLALLTPRPAAACSQCLCGSPTPADFLLGGTGAPLSCGLEDVYLSKSNALGSGPGRESQTEHRVAALLMLRAPERLALRLRVPYSFKSNEQAPAGEPAATTRSHGLGDVEVLARLDLADFPGLLAPAGALSAVAGLTVPTGSNEARDESGERLDAHLQPGTGAWSWTAGLAADRAAFRVGLTWAPG
ncbi:MAG TPA: hypothetical protein VMS93_06920 [Candidatus Saccharimonadales bacterium]|nr:hypothetical protein [Candidatus Saccharimonadales bacterium]